MRLRGLESLGALCGVVVVAAAAASCCSSNNGFEASDGGGVDATAARDGGTFGGSDGAIFGVGDAAADQVAPGLACDTASCSGAGGTCQATTCVIQENPGMVSPGTIAMLGGTGTADSSFAWLYPYDKTVFPRGLLPPTFQFGGTAPDATYVHVSFPGLDYKGYYGAANPARLALSGPVWKAITLAALPQVTVKVDVTKISGGAVSGPVTEGWSIAAGSLRGTIYYETYDSAIAGGLGSVGIMRIQPGATQPSVIKSGCGNVCHTASADGSTLVASAGLFASPSASYDLKNGAALIYSEPAPTFTYGALYPDGSLLMSATGYRLSMLSTTPSGLYDTHTGANIAAPGWDGVVKSGGTPAFSPDGKHIAFNHEDTGGGHTLAAMDFDLANNHTFSNLADIASDGARTLAWPAFTPDGNWVVYHAGSSTLFETDNGETGDVFITDLATHTVHRLDALDGYQGSAAQTYLPASDPNLNFAPTVLPEAVGGYFWVVFTSHRSYGNMLPSMQGAPGPDGGTPDEYGKLWVAAIDLSPTAGKDPSHPAFFLDGQELLADNLRGFWVLSPCKADGSDCNSGDECCDGFCRGADGGALACVAPPGGCSNKYEKCKVASDCCESFDQCVNGRCAAPLPK